MLEGTEYTFGHGTQMLITEIQGHQFLHNGQNDSPYNSLCSTVSNN